MLIVPDVHGRTFWEAPVMEALGKEHIVFLGDYLDPYPYEGISEAEAFLRFGGLIALKKEHPDDITLLLGNHDLHYLDGNLLGGRYDFLHGARNRKAFTDRADLFQIAYETQVAGRKYLLTHAGVKWGWIIYNRETLGIKRPEDVAPTLNAMWWDEARRKQLLATFADIPHSRGGRHLYGSPVWNDLEDMDDSFEELDGYYQIFGHSQQKEYPVIGDNFACLDCREAFALTEEGKIWYWENRNDYIVD